MLSMIHTYKLNNVDPQAWLAEVLARFVDHALRLTETVQGQLALLVRFQWVGGRLP
jgi:hypothetical protein